MQLDNIEVHLNYGGLDVVDMKDITKIGAKHGVKAAKKMDKTQLIRVSKKLKGIISVLPHLKSRRVVK